MKILKKLFSFIFLIILIIITIIGYKGYKMYKEAITKTPIENKIKEIKNIENYTELNNISQDLIDAVIAVEDHRFYVHKGIDLISTTKAIFTNIKMRMITFCTTVTIEL